MKNNVYVLMAIEMFLTEGPLKVPPFRLLLQGSFVVTLRQ